MALRILLLALLLCPLSIVRADRAAEMLVLATYKIAGEGSTATGLVVFKRDEDSKVKRHLVTAHHVFKQMRGETFTLVSRKPKEDGSYRRDEIQIPLREKGEPLWKKHPREDLAVLPLPDEVEIEALSIDCIATEKTMADVHTGDGIRCAVFPEKSEANGAGFPLLRGGNIASFPLIPIAPHPMYLVHTTTWPGDSGGPVMHSTRKTPGGRPLVIGIVRGMRSITDKEKSSRYVESSTSYPLDIGEVLHAALVRDLLPR